MAISQNIGTTITALLPALFAAVAPPGSTNVPARSARSPGITIIAALAAWSARETYRVHLNDLGDRNAVPVPKSEYDQMRAQTIANAGVPALAWTDTPGSTAVELERPRCAWSDHF